MIGSWQSPPGCFDCATELLNCERLSVLGQIGNPRNMPKIFGQQICHGGRSYRALLCRPPVVRLLFVVHMPDARDKRMVPFFLRPGDGFMLCFEGGQHMVRMILDNIIIDVRSLLTSLWPHL